jgi:hypothetical protein
MNLSIYRRGSLAALLLGMSIVAANPSSAASACKGLSEDQCASSDSCGWVNSYLRKDGREVKAFCRSKGKKRSAAAKSSQTKSAQTASAGG